MKRIATENLADRPWKEDISSSRITYLKHRDKRQRISSCSVFGEYVKYFEDDPYWKEVFKKMSEGKLPKNFFFKSPYLIFKKRKEFSIKVESEPCKEDAEKVREFLRQYGYLSSEKDMMTDDEESSVSSAVGGRGSLIVTLLLKVSRSFPVSEWEKRLMNIIK